MATSGTAAIAAAIGGGLEGGLEGLRGGATACCGGLCTAADAPVNWQRLLTVPNCAILPENVKITHFDCHAAAAQRHLLLNQVISTSNKTCRNYLSRPGRGEGEEPSPCSVSDMESVTALFSSTAAAAALVKALSASDWPGGAAGAVAAARAAKRSAGVVKLTAASINQSITSAAVVSEAKYVTRQANPLHKGVSTLFLPDTTCTASTGTPANLKFLRSCGETTCQSWRHHDTSMVSCAVCI